MIISILWKKAGGFESITMKKNSHAMRGQALDTIMLLNSILDHVPYNKVTSQKLQHLESSKNSYKGIFFYHTHHSRKV